MAFQSLSTNILGQKEALIEGKKYLVQKDLHNKEFVYIEGKKYYLSDPILQLRDNLDAEKEKLEASFDERIEFHKTWKDRWLGLQERANQMYKEASEGLVSAYKKYDDYMASIGLRKYTELTGEHKKEADSILADASDCRKLKIRSSSDSFFYGNLAINESNCMMNYTYMQAAAETMLENYR